MQRIIIVLAGLNGFLGVAAGAFGAHGLKSRLTAEALAVFETAARYHLYHSLALGVAAALAGNASAKLLSYSAIAFQAGILLFCGSLYAMALSRMEWKWLGPVTPLGGLMLMAGWVLLALSAGMRPDLPRN